MGKQIPILDPKTEKPVPHHFHAWRCTDGRQFQELERAVEHQLYIIAEKQLDLIDFDDSTGKSEVIQERKK